VDCSWFCSECCRLLESWATAHSAWKKREEQYEASCVQFSRHNGKPVISMERRRAASLSDSSLALRSWVSGHAQTGETHDQLAQRESSRQASVRQ
jgi:hypothetical protein